MKAADGIVVCNDTLPLFQDEADKVEINDQIVEELRRNPGARGDQMSVDEFIMHSSENIRQPTTAEKIEDLARELLLAGYTVQHAWQTAKNFYEEEP